jgi:hypothetical protein
MCAARQVRDALAGAATCRETLAAFLALLAVWGLTRIGLLPVAATLLLVPALAPTMVLDAVAYNELGVRAAATFPALLVVFAYGEAVLVGASIRAVRRGRSGGSAER